MGKVATGLLTFFLLAGQLNSPAGAHGRVPTCFGKPATILGTQQSDRIQGTAGDDVIVGLKGRDYIEGNGGDDLICGGPGKPDRVSDDEILIGDASADRSTEVRAPTVAQAWSATFRTRSGDPTLSSTRRMGVRECSPGPIVRKDLGCREPPHLVWSCSLWRPC